ncbi:MAG: beta-phosphoglucomutase [Anaerolineaceae bacterium]|nr:beta-phosphoglucomutase [Anaerolineaceae bacterium]
MLQHTKGFIFDLDGVITDTAEFHYLAWKQLADEEGILFTREDNEHLRGISRRESLNRLLKGRPIDEYIAQSWMERKNNYYKEYLKQITPNFALPGVSQFLEEASKIGLKIGLGSASKNAREVIERLQLHKAFDAIGDGFSVVNGKPAPDLFIWVAGRLNLSPHEIVVFEDAEAGIDAALKGGFWTVGLGTANVHKAHVIAANIASVSVQTVIDAIEQINASTH